MNDRPDGFHAGTDTLPPLPIPRDEGPASGADLPATPVSPAVKTTAGKLPFRKLPWGECC